MNKNALSSLSEPIITAKSPLPCPPIILLDKQIPDSKTTPATNALWAYYFQDFWVMRAAAENKWAKELAVLPSEVIAELRKRAQEAPAPASPTVQAKSVPLPEPVAAATVSTDQPNRNVSGATTDGKSATAGNAPSLMPPQQDLPQPAPTQPEAPPPATQQQDISPIGSPAQTTTPPTVNHNNVSQTGSPAEAGTPSPQAPAAKEAEAGSIENKAPLPERVPSKEIQVPATEYNTTTPEITPPSLPRP